MKMNSERKIEVQLVNQHRMAELLECTPRTIHNLHKRGKIPVVKVGRLVRFQPDRVIAALEENPGHSKSLGSSCNN